MTSQSKSRTDQKLRYAVIHLEELKCYPNATSNDEWENAHQESCFFHLVGSIEAILHEINDGYSLGLSLHKVTWCRVCEKLNKTGQSSPAFNHLDYLKNKKTSWLALLFEWRNHGTHRRRISKVVNLSAVRTVDNEFHDPRSGKVQNVYPGCGCLNVMEQLVSDVGKLIEHCRRLDPKL